MVEDRQDRVESFLGAKVAGCVEVAVAAFVVELQVADEGDAGPLRDLERQGGGDRLGLAGTGRGLEVDVVVGELWVLFRCRLA